MNKQIFFRCDANSTIGMGHVMRCLSIADAFTDKGYAPVFLLADNSVEKLICDRGFEAKVLHADFRQMEEEFPKISDLLKLAGDSGQPILFVDSYFTAADYLQRLRQLSCVVYIDDVLDYPYPVDVLINYNIFAEETAYKRLYNSSDVVIPKLLLGTKYVPLRKQFSDLSRRTAVPEVKNILISTGGADSEHIALQLARYLQKNNILTDVCFHFLVGAMNTDLGRLEEIATQKENIILEKNVTDMASLMLSCDLAVAASGSTLYELCACGVPIINYSFADNQLGIAAKLEELGVSRYVGDYRYSGKESFCKSIFDSIRELCCNPVQRANMIKKGYSTADGYGADRVVMKLVSRHF